MEARATVLKSLFVDNTVKNTNIIVFQDTAAVILRELTEAVGGGDGGKSYCSVKFIWEQLQYYCF